MSSGSCGPGTSLVTVQRVNVLAVLAARHGLEDRTGVFPDGLSAGASDVAFAALATLAADLGPTGPLLPLVMRGGPPRRHGIRAGIPTASSHGVTLGPVSHGAQAGKSAGVVCDGLPRDLQFGQALSAGMMGRVLTSSLVSAVGRGGGSGRARRGRGSGGLRPNRPAARPKQAPVPGRQPPAGVLRPSDRSM